MKHDIAQRWVAALRSGKFSQTRGRLRRIHANRPAGPHYREGYCCLGVLCELAVADGVIERKVHDFETYGDSQSWSDVGLPETVQRWAGIKTDSGRYDGESLAGDNDAGVSFTEIADLIERRVDEL